MVMLDVLSNALISIKNVEAKGGKQVVIWPSSKLVGNVLRVMQRYGYIGEFEYVYDGSQGFTLRLVNCRSGRRSTYRPGR